jgi:GR25 family glycosyltransferase involved in LPS biosynthesis
MSFINKFFDKIYVINLFDKIERWEKVSKQFRNRNIKIDRFVAIDGRCKQQGDKGCNAKAKTFETSYNIKISNKRSLPSMELIPAASLTIGTILILRHMVKHKLKHILICEDDIELSHGFEKKFKQGIDELKGTKYEKMWDVLYLGCGNKCGNNDISYEKRGSAKNLSTLSQFLDEEIYVKNKNDLRMPCEDGCNEITDHISIADHAGGSWCYAFSLKGARKILKLIDNDAGNHVDQIYQRLENKGGVKALAFNPPIVWHEEGAIRKDTDIPWKY